MPEKAVSTCARTDCRGTCTQVQYAPRAERALTLSDINDIPSP